MNTKLLGALGEQAVARLLREKGYTIIAANYKTTAGELDVVARQNKTLCIVEVKTRKEGGMLPPKEAVDFNKQENIKSATATLINQMKITDTVRYDIAEVLVDHNNKITGINHIENAF